MIETTGKQIATNKITIKDCFADEMWYSIPDYQRPYVWGIDQIYTLLDDIAYAAEYTPENQYFLGSLVLHCCKKTIDDTKFIENSVLDGQQRLTTLYLLHAVIRDITVKKTRKDSCAKTIFQMGDPDDGIPERTRIKFQIREEVENFIDEFVKPEGGTLKKEQLISQSKSSKNVSVRNMAEAILIIHRWVAIEEHLHIDNLYPYLRKYVILIYVASSELEDSFRLFTVLNDRGIKLRNSDILKALNLKEVSKESKQQAYARFWEELEGELGEDFDEFLSYIRTILVKEKARNNLLKEFEDKIYQPKSFNQATKKYEATPSLLSKGDETFELIKSYKKQYDVIFGGNNHHLTNSWAFDNLIQIMMDTALSDIWIPPLLAYRANFGEVQLYTFLTKLENKFSGDWIARETPTTRIEAMNGIIKEIEQCAKNFNNKEQGVSEVLNSDIFDFNKKEFFQQLETNTIYGRRFARYILRKIDYLLESPNHKEKRGSYSMMSVEHVLPQNPAAESLWVKDFSEKDRETWTHRLGNLVLISRRKNTSQGRLDFSLKKERYFKTNVETFPNSIKVMIKGKWSLEDLKSHHNYLVGLLKKHYGFQTGAPAHPVR